MFHLVNYIWFYWKRKGNKEEIISKVVMKEKSHSPISMQEEEHPHIPGIEFQK